MGAVRTTNKDIAEKLDTLIDLMTAQAMQENVAPAAQPKAEAEAVTKDVKLDEAYLEHQKVKAQAHATAKGSEVVLYVRRNKAGENKVAYALRPRYDEQIVKQPSHIGAVASLQPAS